MRYFLKIAYDGSKFYGFQRLENHVTVQKVLEDALSVIDKSKVIVKGAGRTDRGVHALGQGVHFDLVHSIPEEGLTDVLNRMLAPSICVKACYRVTEAFHARFSVLKKRYRYCIYLGEYQPFLFDYTLEYSDSLDFSLMEEASRLFLGVHNFQNFVSGKRDHYEAIIYDISFSLKGSFLTIVFEGKSFYRYMVRNLVGALLDVGSKKRDIQDIFQALHDPHFVHPFQTAKPNGLYLDDVIYEDFS